MRRLAILALLTALTGAQEEQQKLDLRPQWTAGEAYRRTFERRLVVRGKMNPGRETRKVSIDTTEKREWEDGVLAVRDGLPTYVRRKVTTHTLRGRSKLGQVVQKIELPEEQSLEGKTVLTQDDILGHFDTIFAEKDLAVGDTFRKVGKDGLHDVSAKVVLVAKHKGHPAAKLKVQVTHISTLKNRELEVNYKGYVYFATDIRKPLKIEMKGPAILRHRFGDLKGTARYVMTLEMLDRRVQPRDPPPKPVVEDKPEPAPAKPEPKPLLLPEKSTAEEALLKPRWTRGEQSVVQMSVTERVAVEGLRGRTVSTVQYDEWIDEVADGPPTRVRRRYTRHEERIVATLGGRTRESGVKRHPMHGRTYTFVRKDGSLVPEDGELPKKGLRDFQGPISGADFEVYLPGRVVKLGEQWEADWFETRRALGPLNLGSARLTLKAIADDTAYIEIETSEPTGVTKDEPLGTGHKWVKSGLMTFSIKSGKVRGVAVTTKASMDGLAGQRRITVSRHR